ncbi:PREDICTED: lysozyme-like protein 1, partial [Phaethon lepturus]|uniref:lysozyme-like protein 1 n=1 Tax=Phaethon lepturus TaxID=97097 RepID=UPI0005307FA3
MGSLCWLLLPLLASLTTVIKAKVFSRCKLAHLLQEEGLDGSGGYSLTNWLCMAFYESTVNTAAQSINADGSTDYGIFQISSQLQCSDNRSPSDNCCRMACRGTTALLRWGQPQERRQQPKTSCSAQLHPVAKMEPQGR